MYFPIDFSGSLIALHILLKWFKTVWTLDTSKEWFVVFIISHKQNSTLPFITARSVLWSVSEVTPGGTLMLPWRITFAKFAQYDTNFHGNQGTSSKREFTNSLLHRINTNLIIWQISDAAHVSHKHPSFLSPPPWQHCPESQHVTCYMFLSPFTPSAVAEPVCPETACHVWWSTPFMWVNQVWRDTPS